MFDEEKAKCTVDFINCLKHTKGKWRRQPGSIPGFPADWGIGEQGEEVLPWNIDKAPFYEAINCLDLY